MADLENLRGRITGKVAALEETGRLGCISLGDALSTTKSEGAWKETFGEKLSSVKQIRGEIREKNRTLDRLRELERGLKDVADEQRSVSSQLEQLQAVLEEHYEGIGAAAFELYRQSPALFRDITELFDDMEQL
ncbi:MAG: hypothetical protein JW852_05165, partial [Spirochaetales bacterium]|nr:hypothetical protein [Spirochaetales bacterium]